MLGAATGLSGYLYKKGIACLVRGIVLSLPDRVGYEKEQLRYRCLGTFILLFPFGMFKVWLRHKEQFPRRLLYQVSSFLVFAIVFWFEC
jgi:hypothetical protein